MTPEQLWKIIRERTEWPVSFEIGTAVRATLARAEWIAFTRGVIVGAIMGVVMSAIIISAIRLYTMTP